MPTAISALIGSYGVPLTNYPTIPSSSVLFALNFNQANITSVTDQSSYNWPTYPYLTTGMTLSSGGPYSDGGKYLYVNGAAEGGFYVGQNATFRNTVQPFITGSNSWSIEFNYYFVQTINWGGLSLLGTYGNVGGGVDIGQVWDSNPAIIKIGAGVANQAQTGGYGPVGIELNGLITNSWNHIVWTYKATSSSTGSHHAWVNGKYQGGVTFNKSTGYDFYLIGSSGFLLEPFAPGQAQQCYIDNFRVLKGNPWTENVNYKTPTSAWTA